MDKREQVQCNQCRPYRHLSLSFRFNHKNQFVALWHEIYSRSKTQARAKMQCNRGRPNRQLFLIHFPINHKNQFVAMRHEICSSSKTRTRIQLQCIHGRPSQYLSLISFLDVYYVYSITSTRVILVNSTRVLRQFKNVDTRANAMQPLSIEPTPLTHFIITSNLSRVNATRVLR